MLKGGLTALMVLAATPTLSENNTDCIIDTPKKVLGAWVIKNYPPLDQKEAVTLVTETYSFLAEQSLQNQRPLQLDDLFTKQIDPVTLKILSAVMTGANPFQYIDRPCNNAGPLWDDHFPLLKNKPV